MLNNNKLIKNMEEEFEKIQQEITKLEHVCKQKNIDCYIESLCNYFLFKSKNYNILFNMTYLKHFDSYSLTIDIYKKDESFSSTWNLFPTLREMMVRITNLISHITENPIHL